MTSAHNAWTPGDLSALGREGISISVDASQRAEASGDFGNLVKGESLAVVYPRDAREVESVIRFANARKLCFTARGGGRSSGGQSVARRAPTLSLARLDRVGRVDSDRGLVTCEPGARWRPVVEATLAEGWIPKVVPLNLDLTVGGTLSVGGIGSTSHRFGTAAANVVAVEAVTGAGAPASSVDDEGLLAATMAGLGRCAVLTSATLALRRAPSHVYTIYLLYDELEPWLADLRLLREERRFDHADGFCTGSLQGLRTTPTGRRPLTRWFYGMHLSLEHDAGAKPDPDALLAGLRHRWLVHQEDNAMEAFVARADARLDIMARTGSSALPHPWLEFLVPVEKLTELLTPVLDALPPALGDGHRVAMLAPEPQPPLFTVPPGRDTAIFAVLPMGVPPPLLAGVLPALRGVNQMLLAAGAKRYLAGWLELDEAGWRNHYGDRFAAWQEAKRRYDPCGVLSAACF